MWFLKKQAPLILSKELYPFGARAYRYIRGEYKKSAVALEWLTFNTGYVWSISNVRACFNNAKTIWPYEVRTGRRRTIYSPCAQRRGNSYFRPAVMASLQWGVRSRLKSLSLAMSTVRRNTLKSLRQEIQNERKTMQRDYCDMCVIGLPVQWLVLLNYWSLSVRITWEIRKMKVIYQ